MGLSDRLHQIMAERPNVTVAKLSEVAGVSYEMVRRYTLGIAKPRVDKLTKIADFLGVSASWLQFGSEAAVSSKKIESNISEIGTFGLWEQHTPLKDDEVEVPFLKDICFDVGNGFSDDIMDYNNFKLRFSKATLRRVGVQADNAVCVIAEGNSMEPVIPDDSTVGIDMGNKTIRDGKIYAINHGGLLRIKLLYNMPNDYIKIRSYNEKEHPVETVHLSEIFIIGKVFWYSVLL